MKTLLNILICLVLTATAGCRRGPGADVVVEKRGLYTYHGERTVKGKSCYGVLTEGDSVVYSGNWLNGKRQGEGLTTDSLGREVLGQWDADTIVSGTIKDSLGTYSGELNARFEPDGHGTYHGADGSWYDGTWKDGKRNGFGCGVAANGKVKTGEWRQDRYRGERMTYTAERIYGIDISRYQHGRGRKKYPIYWNRVRITHLGSMSRKNVSGSVNYPVSFVYIKSTEGISVRNRFYLSDYREARRNGIHCGAYHFFSTTSPAAQQAHYFLKNSRFSKGDFPPVLDVEPSPSQIRKMGGPAVLFARIRTWMNIVRHHTGVRPILYVSQTFVNRYLPQAPDLMHDNLVWIARYGEYRPDVRLAFWQLCPDGRVSGIRGEVDINVFNGYRDTYNAFLAKERIR